MITSLTVRNFRTLHDVTWEPKKLSILVGPNNSGKTNLAYALRFLGLSASRMTLNEAGEDTCGRASEIVTREGWAHPVELGIRAVAPVGERYVEFDYRLVLSDVLPDESRPPGLNVDSERLSRLDLPADTPLLNRTLADATLLDEVHSNSAIVTRAGGALCGPNQTLLSCLPDEGSWPSAIAFRDHLRAFRYYRVSAEALRDDASNDASGLGPHGEDLAAVLKRMQARDADGYQRLVRLVQQFDGSVAGFELIGVPDGRVIAGVRDTASNFLSPLSSMSDGTLQYMTLAMIALQSASPRTPAEERPTLIIYEEPENGLYVRNLHPLVDRLRAVSEATQAIITTHNPFLLDFFDNEVESIFVLHNGENGTEITPANPRTVSELLETMSMGEMLYQELLTCE